MMSDPRLHYSTGNKVEAGLVTSPALVAESNPTTASECRPAQGFPSRLNVVNVARPESISTATEAIPEGLYLLRGMNQT